MKSSACCNVGNRRKPNPLDCPEDMVRNIFQYDALCALTRLAIPNNSNIIQVFNTVVLSQFGRYLSKKSKILVICHEEISTEQNQEKCLSRKIG